MTLREQILKELRIQDSIMQKEIKDYESKMDAESFAMNSINGGPLAGTARSACQARLDKYRNEKNRLTNENQWVSEMLAKYK